MRRLTLRFAACLMCALALLLTPGGRADAGLFPDIGNFFFGPPGTPYFRTAYYYPPNYYTAYYGYGYRAYRPLTYSPSPRAPVRVRTCYPPAWPLYSPCNPCACSPCSLGACPGGVCAADYGTQPVRNGGWKATLDEADPPKTFKEDEAGDADDESGRLPDASGQHESLKPETTVPQRESAPIKEPEAGEDVPKKEDGKKADEDKPTGDGTKSVPPVDVDEKVTWRVLTSRRRLTIRSRFPTPGIARTRVTPNENWVPVPVETKIVSK